MTISAIEYPSIELMTKHLVLPHRNEEWRCDQITNVYKVNPDHFQELENYA